MLWCHKRCQVVLAFAVAQIICSLHDADAYEVGFYPRLPTNPAQRQDLIDNYRALNAKNLPGRYKIILEPSKEVPSEPLACYIQVWALDKFDLGLVEDSNSTIFFNQAEAEQFLRAQKLKGIVQVMLLKSMWDYRESMEKLDAFFATLKSNRLIVCGASSSGKFVLLDRKALEDDESDQSQVGGNLEDPNFSIEIKGANQIGIGIQDRVFTQSQISRFLNDKKHKKILLVKHDESKVGVADLKGFIDGLGFEQVVYKPLIDR